MNKNKNIIAWVTQVVMGVLYIVASSGKVISDPEVIQNFDNWGYPYGFYMVIGLLELICGLLLFYPKTAGYASIVLFCVMIGAVITHVVHDEGIIVLRPLLHMLGLLVIFYFRFIEDIRNSKKDILPLGMVS